MSTIIAGCGFGGAVVARQLAEANEKVRIIERRNHIGGNCYDEMDAYGILVHTYGPHIFHTKIKEVYEYLSRFTKWYPYQHEVVANIHGNMVPVPFNLHSIDMVFEKEKAQRIPCFDTFALCAAALKLLLAFPCKVAPKGAVGGAVGGIEIFLPCMACNIRYSPFDIGQF